MRQLMQHFRNVHISSATKGVPKSDEEANLSDYLARHGVWRCAIHNFCFATLTARTPRRDGLHRLKYFNCSHYGRGSAPMHVLPSTRVLIHPSTISPVAVKVIPKSTVVTAPSFSRLQLPIFGDLSIPLDPLAMSRGKEHFLPLLVICYRDLSGYLRRIYPV